MRAIDPAAAWGPGEYLLANVLDAVRAGNWLTVELNKKKYAKNPYPEPVRRPGDPEPKSTKAPLVSGAELADWLRGAA